MDDLARWKLTTILTMIALVASCITLLVTINDLDRITESTYDMCTLNNNLIDLINTQSGLIEKAYSEEYGNLTRITPMDCVALYGE